MTDKLPALGPFQQPFSRSLGPSRVRIVADSATDILPTHARALGISVVPNRIILDGVVLRDGIDITPSQFFARLPRARSVYTEPASARELYAAYLSAFREGATDILSIHVSSRLSQVVDNALTARQYLAHAPVQVIDTRQAGIGMWPAVIWAAKLASTGAHVEDIRSTTLTMLSRTRVYFLVETLEYLRRSGRIGRAQELIGTLTSSHPILTIADGEVSPVETIRGRERALLRIRELMLAAGPLESVLICGSAIETIAEFERLLAPAYEGPIQKTWLGPTLGANTGPVLALAMVTR
jgi:DegV family protein with EDD domain